MKLTPISEIRRKELRRAAFDVLQTEGLAGATLEKVAARAGASKGIVLHYFANKQELFEQVMREANAALRGVVVARMEKSRSAKERLEAVIAPNFDPKFFQPLVCQAWLSLCAELPREPALARIQRVIHSRMDSNLKSALREVVSKSDVESIALGISSLIDGLWLRNGVAAGGVSADQAAAELRNYVQARTGIRLDLNP